MAQVSFSNVSYTYPGFATPAVDRLSLMVADGEFLSVVGPSGGGKTTVLRLLSGLVKPTSGEILVAGDIVTQLPAGSRDVGTATFNQTLYAHLTVEQNIGFPLTVAGEPAHEIANQVTRIADALGLRALLHELPRALTPAQRGAVSLARAMVRHTGVLILDEPLGHLDAEERRHARLQLSTLQRRTGTTTLYITRDPTEAMILGDRIAVIIDGRLRQVAAPLDVYHRPDNLAVARFFGAPPMNTLTAIRTPEGARVGDLLLPVPGRIDVPDGAPLVVGVRAENVNVLPRGAVLRVSGVEHTGTDAYVSGFLVADAGHQPLSVRCPARSAPRRGEDLLVDVLNDDHVLFFDPVTGIRL